jgi:purine nucleoside phosphorylase
MAGALETVALLGAWTVLLISTAESVQPGLYPGNIAMITDHINAEVYSSFQRMG